MVNSPDENNEAPPLTKTLERPTSSGAMAGIRGLVLAGRKKLFFATMLLGSTAATPLLPACGASDTASFFDESKTALGEFGDFVGNQVDDLTTNLSVIWGGALNTVGLRENAISLKQLEDASKVMNNQDADVSDKVLGYLYNNVVQPAFFDQEYTERMLKLPTGSLQESFTDWYMLSKCLKFLSEERNANLLKSDFARVKADKSYKSPKSDEAEKELEKAEEKLANAIESGTPKSSIVYFNRAVEKARRDLQDANAGQRKAVEGANSKADKAEERADQLRNLVSGLLAGELKTRNTFGDAYSKYR